MTIGDFRKLFVIVRRPGGAFTLHRYFRIGDEWAVSVDLQDDDLHACINWIRSDNDVADAVAAPPPPGGA